MKLILPGLVFAILLGLLGERTYAAYHWKQEADSAIHQAAAADHWLHDPVIAVQGKSLSRADLLDVLLVKALRPAPAAPAPAGK